MEQTDIPAAPRTALHFAQLHKLAVMKQLPDWLTEAAVVELWHPSWQQSLKGLARAQRQGIAGLVTAAIKSDGIAVEIELGNTVTEHAPPGGWAVAAQARGEWYDRGSDDTADLYARTAPRTRKLPNTTWIHRNALRAWLSKTEAPILPADCPLRAWWPDAKDWKIGSAKPKKISAADLVSEVNDYQARNGGSIGAADRAVAQKYGVKAETLERARKRKNANERPARYQATKAAGDAANSNQGKGGKGAFH